MSRAAFAAALGPGAPADPDGLRAFAPGRCEHLIARGFPAGAPLFGSPLLDELVGSIAAGSLRRALTGLAEAALDFFDGETDCPTCGGPTFAHDSQIYAARPPATVRAALTALAEVRPGPSADPCFARNIASWGAAAEEAAAPTGAQPFWSEGYFCALLGDEDGGAAWASLNRLARSVGLDPYEITGAIEAAS